MKLNEVQTREKIPTGPPGDATSRLKSEAGPAPSMGWTLDYDAGMVTAVKGDQRLLIPVGNVAYMRPEAVVVPMSKLAKGAA